MKVTESTKIKSQLDELDVNIFNLEYGKYNATSVRDHTNERTLKGFNEK